MAVLGLCAMGADYRGCGGGSPPEGGGPLPMGDESCLVDADCPVDQCAVLACVAGECVSLGIRRERDFDGDGVAAAPCGEDCDDTNATVYPGAPETCDGFDQDCDGTIDEGATGSLTTTLEDGLSGASIVGLGEGFAVLGRTSEGDLAGYVIGRDGERGGVETLVPSGLGGPPLEELVAAGAGGRVVVAFALEGGPPWRLELTGGAAGLEAVSPPELLTTSGDATSMAVHLFAGAAFVAFDLIDGGEEQRWLWAEPTGELTPLLAGDAGPFLADDGGRLAVTNGETRVDFLSAEGALLASQALTGPFATGRALTGSSGAVVAAYRDSFDHNLTTVTPSAVRRPSAAPTGSRDDLLSVFTLAEGILVTRINSFEPRAWILAPDLRTYLATFTPRQISAVFGPPSRMSAATDGGRVSAMLASYEGRSALALLRCATAP